MRFAMQKEDTMKKLSFNDGWKMNGDTVIVPHDVMIHAARSADATSGSAQAYFHGGKYIYMKRHLFVLMQKRRYYSLKEYIETLRCT